MARELAGALLEAIKSAPLDELLEDGGPRGHDRPARPLGRSTATTAARPARSGRLPRRSPEQIAKMLDQVVALVKRSPEGLRAEQIRSELGLEPKEMPRMLKEGISTKFLKTKGHKRATTYFAK